MFRDLNVRIAFTINYDRISETLLRPYRLLVILRDGMIWPGGYLEPNGYDYSHFLGNAGPWPREQFVPCIAVEVVAELRRANGAIRSVADRPPVGKYPAPAPQATAATTGRSASGS
jgi:hypothetical protein